MTHMMIPCTPPPGARTHAEIEAQREKRELLTRMHENEAARDRVPQQAEQLPLLKVEQPKQEER